MNGWTAKDIERITGIKPKTYSRVGRKIEPSGLKYIKHKLALLGIEYVEEHRFHNVRRFRFDVAILNQKVAIEYEGLVSDKSRHTTLEGYSKDCEKYNLATTCGWKVLRYTTLNYKNIDNDINEIIELSKKNKKDG
jgi:very-short-patch-repair endonuclease